MSPFLAILHILVRLRVTVGTLSAELAAVIQWRTCGQTMHGLVRVGRWALVQQPGLVWASAAGYSRCAGTQTACGQPLISAELLLPCRGQIAPVAEASPSSLQRAHEPAAAES